MTEAVATPVTAEMWWQRWDALATSASAIGARMTATGQRWREAHDAGAREQARELWTNEYEPSVRAAEIARARANVAYGHYLVAHYGLREGDVFDIAG